MKLIVKDKLSEIKPNQMKYNTLYRVTTAPYDDYRNIIVILVYGGLMVRIDKPENSWNNLTLISGPGWGVTPLEKGEEITLIQE